MAGVALAPSADATITGPLRVLLTGDSITHGFDGDYTWRFRLAQEFTRQGVPVDFVGSKRLPHVKAGWTTSVYADPNFDSDHFATGGTTVARQTTLIESEVRQQQPNLVVLAAGVNDLRWGATPAELVTRVKGWVANARAGRPNLSIVLSPVLGASDTTRPWLPARVSEYDALLRQALPDLSTAESPVTIADTEVGWNVHDHTSEDLHPNPTGEAHIAQRVAEHLHGLGVLPATPQIYRKMVWARNLPVDVRLDGRRALLTWDRQAVTGVKVTMRLGGTRARQLPWVYSNGTMTTGELSSGGVYEFRLTAMRGRMVSELGPITRVKAPQVRPKQRPATSSRAIAKAPAVVKVSSTGVRWSRSAGATSYLVKIRRSGSKVWHTKRTRGQKITIRGVSRAKVHAVNAAGTSGGRAAVRSTR